MSTTWEVWRQQLADVQHELDAHIIRDGEWVGIDPTAAPPGLVDTHATLIQIGYVKGWME